MGKGDSIQKTGGSQILVLAGGFCGHERVVALTKNGVKELTELYED